MWIFQAYTIFECFSELLIRGYIAVSYTHLDVYKRQVRDQLEYGKYNPHGRQNIEQYTIAQTERVKHLKPKFFKYEIVSKLSYHFHRDIQLAVYTQGIKTIEQFLILVTQSQNINKSNTAPHYQQRRINYHNNYERDDKQNRDNYRRNFTPPAHNVKQHTAVNNTRNVQKEPHSERNVRDTNWKNRFSKTYDRSVSTMQSKRESAEGEIKAKPRHSSVQTSCSLSLIHI